MMAVTAIKHNQNGPDEADDADEISQQIVNEEEEKQKPVEEVK